MVTTVPAFSDIIHEIDTEPILAGKQMTEQKLEDNKVEVRKDFLLLLGSST